MTSMVEQLSDVTVLNIADGTNKQTGARCHCKLQVAVV